MSVSLHELVRIMPNAKSRAAEYIHELNTAMLDWEINNPLREAAFLAQIAHESGELLYTEEIYSGAKYDIGRLAIKLGNTPHDDDDGEKYKGRGLIQITGRENYAACAKALEIDCVENPEYLEDPRYACQSAAWYWQTRGLNELADKKFFKEITKKINGGYNGYKERCKYYERALDVLGVNLGAGC